MDAASQIFATNAFIHHVRELTSMLPQKILLISGVRLVPFLAFTVGFSDVRFKRRLAR